jgi:hypothetical protein
VYEKKSLNIKHGWVFVLLGVVPSVAVGFAGYLVLRLGHDATAAEKMYDNF